MSPSAAAPPTPQEIQRKLSIHSVSKSKPSNVSGTESDSDSINILTPDVATISSHITGSFPVGSSSQHPLSSIAERRSGSGGEDTEDEEDVAEGGWKTADVRAKPRGSVDESVIKSGYLWKKGERRKTWKKRWFVLRPAHLAYYKSSAEYQLLRLLELSDVHSCTKVTLKRHENTFGLISPVRTFYLQASTQQEVQDWVKAIEEARETLMATSTQTSTSTPIPIPKHSKEKYTYTSTSPRSPPQPPSHSPYNHAVTSSDSEDAGANAGSPSSSPTQAMFSFSHPKSLGTYNPDPTKVVLSGYLMKCGSKRRNWRKRWFVLTGEKLWYSTSHMDTKPHRLFSFSDVLDALEYDLPASRLNPVSPSLMPPPTPGGHSDRDESHCSHTFKIVTTKRTLLLCAPSEEDEIKWLGAVRALIARRSGSGIVPGGEGVKGSSITTAPPSDSSATINAAGSSVAKGKVKRLSATPSALAAGGTIHEDARESYA